MFIMILDNIFMFIILCCLQICNRKKQGSLREASLRDIENGMVISGCE